MFQCPPQMRCQAQVTTAHPGKKQHRGVADPVEKGARRRRPRISSSRQGSRARTARSSRSRSWKATAQKGKGIAGRTSTTGQHSEVRKAQPAGSEAATISSSMKNVATTATSPEAAPIPKLASPAEASEARNADDVSVGDRVRLAPGEPVGHRGRSSGEADYVPQRPSITPHGHAGVERVAGSPTSVGPGLTPRGSCEVPRSAPPGGRHPRRRRCPRA